MNSKFQSSASEQGRWFEETSIKALRYAGFEIADTKVSIPEAGIEVDIIAHNKLNIAFYITCKGSIQGDRPGMIRTDTLKKALAEVVALHLSGFGPILAMTSHLPNQGRGVRLLELFQQQFPFEVIDPLHDRRRLKWLANATQAELAYGFGYLPDLVTTGA